jgi:phosphoglycolate phosphatase
VVRAAVFDLDGTLVDSLDDIASALIGAMGDEQLPAPSRADIGLWIGDGARSLVARAVAARLGDIPAKDPIVERVFCRFGERYRATPVAATRVYDGIIPVLDRLDAAGITLGVLSNKPHDLTVAVIERLLPGRFVEVSGQRPGGALKPAPEAGLAIAEALGVAPRLCALIGDSAVDIAAARAAGMVAIGVSWGLRPRAELVAAAPDALADEPAQLLGFLL